MVSLEFPRERCLHSNCLQSLCQPFESSCVLSRHTDRDQPHAGPLGTLRAAAVRPRAMSPPRPGSSSTRPPPSSMPRPRRRHSRVVVSTQSEIQGQKRRKWSGSGRQPKFFFSLLDRGMVWPSQPNHLILEPQFCLDCGPTVTDPKTQTPNPSHSGRMNWSTQVPHRAAHVGLSAAWVPPV